MRFIHISDTHLGYHQYGLQERAEDFFYAFKEAVDYAIDVKADFVIHTGDFFHSSRPSNNIILQGMELVKKLSEAKIPVFVISGNHDRGSQVRDVSPLSILESVGLRLVDTGVVEHDGIFIAGLKYISKAGLRQLNFREVMERYLEETGDGFKILMLHQEFQPFFPDSGLNVHVDIPEGFDYIGIGHYHIAQPPAVINGATVVYPGSTEFTAYNEKEEEKGKGFFDIKVDSDGLKTEFVHIKNRRPFLFFGFSGDEEFREVVLQIKESLQKEYRKDPVLILRGNVRELNPREIHSILETEGIKERILHVQFNLSREEASLPEGVFSELGEGKIREEIKKLLDDEILYEHVSELIERLKTFENTDEMKKFLKENPEVLDI
ncbi:metallophosphoesterase family protein [Persephonella sp.]